MKTKRAIVLTLGLFLMASLVGAQAMAQATITGTLSNFDVWNRTGQMANDFDIVLQGIAPSDISNFYTGDYPNVMVTSVAGGTKIRWSGDTTLAGTAAHFGLSLRGDLDPTSVQMNWTFNGSNIGNLPDVWQLWRTLTTNRIQDDITNRAIQSVLIQRRGFEWIPPIDLGDLIRGGQLWNAATLIDPSPFVLASGNTALFDFPTITRPINEVMIYEVFDAGGQSMMTFLNAAVVVPEPASLALMLAGVGLLVRWRRIS